MLTAEGHEVRLATSVVEVISVLKSWAPDIVLTDVQMPGTDGTELCRLIKSQVHRLVPVVLFSTLPDEELAVLAGRCGADGYLSKSRGFESLPQQVLTNVHSHEMYRANGPVRNIPEFYHAFNVKEGDKMFLAPERRVKIW